MISSAAVMQVQGQESNLSGRFLEKTIEEEFRARKVDVAFFDEGGGSKSLFYPRRLLKRAPYRSIYGSDSHSEFLYVYEPAELKVRIECRWQQVSGSCDEKFPYLFDNARETMPERNIWLVVDGGGARADAIFWLKRKASLEKTKTIRVYSLVETRKAIKRLIEEGLA